MLGGADNPNGELPSYITGADIALLQLLLERPAEPKMEQTLTGLLCELVWYFTEGLKAPRWLRTADGVKFISEVAA
ncbi:hypothetical protein UZ470_23005 [Escherichia coli]|nr:hypothetical protein [Escherichia coli]